MQAPEEQHTKPMKHIHKNTASLLPTIKKQGKPNMCPTVAPMYARIEN